MVFDYLLLGIFFLVPLVPAISVHLDAYVHKWWCELYAWILYGVYMMLLQIVPVAQFVKNYHKRCNVREILLYLTFTIWMIAQSYLISIHESHDVVIFIIYNLYCTYRYLGFLFIVFTDEFEM